MELIGIKLLLNNPSYLYITFYFFFVCLHFFLEPVRWTIYIPSKKQNQFILFSKIFFFTAFISYIFPLKMGLPLRIILLRNKAGLNITEIGVFLLLDSFVYYALWGMSALVITLMIALMPSVFVYSFSIQVLLFIPIIVIILFLLHFIIIRRKNKKIGCEDNSRKIILFFKDWFAKIFQISQQIKPKILAMAGLVSCIDITSHIFRHWALLNMLGYDLPWLDFAVVTCLSIFAGLISMMPMGLGGYDTAIVLLLTQAGIPLGVAIAIPILNRFGNIVVSILLGIWSGWGLQMNPFDLTYIKQWIRQMKNHIN